VGTKSFGENEGSLYSGGGFLKKYLEAGQGIKAGVSTPKRPSRGKEVGEKIYALMKMNMWHCSSGKAKKASRGTGGVRTNILRSGMKPGR